MFRKNKILISCIGIFILFVSSVLGNTKILKAANGEVSLVMPERVKVGQDFDILVNVKDIKDIHGASLELNFDSSIISIQDIMPGNLYYGLNEGKNYRHFRWMENSTNGKISTAILLTGLDNGISAEGSIFTVKAKALKEGNVSFKPGSGYAIKLSNSSKTFDNKISAFTAKETYLTIGNAPNETIVKEKLEQENPKIQYTGTWFNHWEPQNSDSSAKFTNDKDASFSFSFEGTGFRWYGLANKFKGKAKITIDGKTEIVNTYSDTEQYKKLFYEIKDLANRKHEVKIEVYTEYINVDFLEILTTKEGSPQTSTPPSGQTTPTVDNGTDGTKIITTTKKIEQTDTSIQFSGEWLNHWENRNSGGSAKFTSAKEAFFQFSFDGTGFKWYGLANKFKGKAKITIDGKEEIIDTYSAEEKYQKLFFSKEGLTNGNHTVKIQTYTDNINVDYIEIIQQTTTNINSSTQPPVNILTGKWTRIEETNPSIKYTGSWLTHNFNENSGGAAKYTNFANATVEFTFTGTGFRWYGNGNKFKGPVTVSIDDKSERVNTYYDGQEYQKLFFEKKGLDYGTHKVKLTLVSDYISIDCIEIENGSVN
jgi:trimeric autotransporter adhesin